jgi:hypothetical protein
MYRLYVGLSVDGSETVIDKDAVIEMVSQHVESFTVLTTQGYFRSKPEDTLVFSVAHESRALIIDLASRLGSHFHQDGIGLEYDGAYTRVTANLM